MPITNRMVVLNKIKHHKFEVMEQISNASLHQFRIWSNVFDKVRSKRNFLPSNMGKEKSYPDYTRLDPNHQLVCMTLGRALNAPVDLQLGP